MKQTVIKIVGEYNHKLISIASPASLRLIYSAAWTQPLIQFSQIFCFDTLENAIAFLDTGFQGHIRKWAFEAEAIDPMPARAIAPSWFLDDTARSAFISYWWKTEGYKSTPWDHWCRANEGTLACQRLRLTKPIFVQPFVARYVPGQDDLKEINWHKGYDDFNYFATTFQLPS